MHLPLGSKGQYKFQWFQSIFMSLEFHPMPSFILLVNIYLIGRSVNVTSWYSVPNWPAQRVGVILYSGRMLAALRVFVVFLSHAAVVTLNRFPFQALPGYSSIFPSRYTLWISCKWNKTFDPNPVLCERNILGSCGSIYSITSQSSHWRH